MTGSSEAEDGTRGDAVGNSEDRSSGPTAAELASALRAGVALYTEGWYHAAHDPWEAVWLELDRETAPTDERFFHGLIQFTAAIYHAREGNPDGASGLATSAREYLAPLPGVYRGVGLDGPRAFCRRLAADPVLLERREPPPLEYEGSPLPVAALAPDALGRAGEAVAEELGYDESVVVAAARFAAADAERDQPALDADSGGTASTADGAAPFASLLVDFVTSGVAGGGPGDDSDRGLVFQRLAAHVDRRERAESDVSGLFDTG